VALFFIFEENRKMKVGDKNYRTIWVAHDLPKIIKIIDQRFLPHQFIIAEITNVAEMVTAIKDMWVRGAGLIGASGGFGMYLATLKLNDLSDREGLEEAAIQLKSTRPTAVNLSYAVDRMLHQLNRDFDSLKELQDQALLYAKQIADEDVNMCRNIGIHGSEIIEMISKMKNNEPVHILTHCNAGWLAFVDYGSALAPVYEAYKRGNDVHVWVDETRPRNQGASLTAWELNEHGIPHTIIADNTGGHLMQHQMVDLVITGSDRCTRTGDVANKIGTYLKALAANDNHIPFYAALPSSTIDWEISDGINEIPIETRSEEEVKYISGQDENGNINKVLLTPKDSPALNYGFDVTPARLITGIITENGIAEASEEGLLKLYPEKRK
jgi:methylthioribose-1-phosphate isomerase